MPLVQAKCTNCGANLEINNTLDAAVCPYCNVPFVVEKAINNYNTANHISAGPVNAYGGSSADFAVRGGVLEKYNGAAMEVVIPNSVKIIEDQAFSGCRGITSVVIPDSVREIGERAFENCTELESVTMGNSVQKIGQSAFGGCAALAAVVIPNSVQTIDSWIFKECSSLSTITIPDSVREIGGGAFSGCSSLTSIVIPDSVKCIRPDAFSGCTALTSVTLPDSLNKIEKEIFSGCRSLRAIKIPESVNEIGDYAFQNCTSLVAIIIPELVGSIGRYAFSGCKSLRTVEIEGNPQCSSNAFSCTPYQEAKNQKAEQKSGCYIATAVYGSYDCPEVWTLRRFRDNTLDRTWYGRAFIRTYYAVSPALVRWFGKDSWFQALFRPMLDRLVDRLRQSGVEDTAYQDKY